MNEYRTLHDGKWGAWLPVTIDIDLFRKQYAFNLANGTVELLCEELDGLASSKPGPVHPTIKRLLGGSHGG